MNNRSTSRSPTDTSAKLNVPPEPESQTAGLYPFSNDGRTLEPDAINPNDDPVVAPTKFVSPSNSARAVSRPTDADT